MKSTIGVLISQLRPVLLGVLWLGSVANAGMAGAATLEVLPSATTVRPGGSLSVDVVVSGPGNQASPSLGAFDPELTFDAALLTLNGHTEGTELDDVGAGEATMGTLPPLAAVNAAENQTTATDVDSTDPHGDTEGVGLTYSLAGGAETETLSEAQMPNRNHTYPATTHIGLRPTTASRVR
jgi:hypothetical protein